MFIIKRYWDIKKWYNTKFQSLGKMNQINTNSAIYSQPTVNIFTPHNILAMSTESNLKNKRLEKPNNQVPWAECKPMKWPVPKSANRQLECSCCYPKNMTGCSRVKTDKSLLSDFPAAIQNPDSSRKADKKQVNFSLWQLRLRMCMK